MNYNKLYNGLIASRKSLTRTKGKGTYYETHHIVPRSLGGTNDPDNLVILTGREHFIAHKLLTKIYPNDRKLYLAYSGMMINKHGRGLTSRQVEDCKRLSNEAAYDENGYHRNSKVGKFTQEQKQEIVNIFKGTTLEKEIIAEMYGVHWTTIIKILKEQGLTGKEIKSIACNKREMRHKLQLLANNKKREGNNKGIPRSKQALELQRESIKKYWQDVREGNRVRKDKMTGWRPIKCIETGRTWPSRNSAKKEFYVQPISHNLVSRTDPNIVFHWEYI